MNVPNRQPGQNNDNLIQPFQVEGANLRGRLVRLGSVADTIITRHGYPEPVSALLGEALALRSRQMPPSLGVQGPGDSTTASGSEARTSATEIRS